MLRFQSGYAIMDGRNSRWRQVEDLKDLLASIEENGELRPGEKAEVERKLSKLACQYCGKTNDCDCYGYLV